MADAQQPGTATGESAAIRASILSFLVKEIDARSGKTDMFLAGHGLLRGQLADPYALIPLSRYVAIFEEAAELLRDPALGARIGTAFDLADIGPTGLLFSGSATIRRAFERLSHSINAVQGSTGTSLAEDEGGHLVWTYGLTDPRLWPRRQDAEFSLAASCKMVRQAFRTGWRPAEIHFEHGQPRDAEPLRQAFGCPVLFDRSANRIVMELSEADRVHRVEDAHFFAVLERHVGNLLEEVKPAEGIRARITSLIAIQLGFRPITIGTMAKELGLSPRTLQRRLTEEGTSLRRIVREHRQDMVNRQPLGPHPGNARMAALLGYADSTVFWRASKSWKGGPPGQS